MFCLCLVYCWSWDSAWCEVPDLFILNSFLATPLVALLCLRHLMDGLGDFPICFQLTLTLTQTNILKPALQKSWGLVGGETSCAGNKTQVSAHTRQIPHLLDYLLTPRLKLLSPWDLLLQEILMNWQYILYCSQYPGGQHSSHCGLGGDEGRCTEMEVGLQREHRGACFA